MKKLTMLFLILFSACITYGQDVSLFDMYKIPNLFYQTLKLNSASLLNIYNTTNDDSGSEYKTFSSSIGLNHDLLYQTPMSKNTVTSSLVFYYYKSTTSAVSIPDEIQETLLSSAYVYSNNSWYITNEKGLFVFADPTVYIYNNRNTINKNDYKQRSVAAALGLGYGRVINVRYIVQAYIISDELQCNLPDDKIIQLGEILERYSNGEYSGKYKNDSDLHFYNDIASITGKPEQQSRIEQILSSSLYKTSTRETGWQAKLGANFIYDETNNFYADPVSPYRYRHINRGTDITAQFAYSLPLSFNKQFSISAEYTLNVDDAIRRMPKLNLSTYLTIDHNYLWSTKFSVYFNTAFGLGTTDRINCGASARSNLVIWNKLSASATLSYSKVQFYDYSDSEFESAIYTADRQQAFAFYVGLNYNIF